MGLGQDVCFTRFEAEIQVARILLDEAHHLAESEDWEGALTVVQFDVHEAFERLLALADDGRSIEGEDES